MFFGEYSHNIDDKGRMSIPSRFRDGLGEQFFVTKGLDQCLFVFPVDEWNNFVEKLNTLPLTKSDARKFMRFFYSGALETSLDKQGRINIPAKLREFGDMTKEVTVIGVGSRIEIWDKETWSTYNAPENLSSDEIAERMEELGI